DFASLQKAMKQRFTFFAQHGGHLSDHGLNSFHYRPASQAELDAIIKKGIENRPVSDVENDQYLTGLVEMLMDLNQAFNWTMQFHANVDRSLSLPNLKKIGPDTGFDAMGSQPDLVGEFRDLFQAMDARGPLPKVIFYSLNPNDWLPLVTMLQSFVGQGDKQHLQLGAAWWFNDTAEGMHRQLQTFAQQSLLPNFVGMLTDSRSFLSYPRHEYFRRVLCNFYGELVEQGRVPYDLEALGRIIKNV
ncbi:truncated glucuronate isomerase, partial [Lacticaseibacillus paracasei subsp. paracasei Lpp126]